MHILQIITGVIQDHLPCSEISHASRLTHATALASTNVRPRGLDFSIKLVLGHSSESARLLESYKTNRPCPIFAETLHQIASHKNLYSIGFISEDPVSTPSRYHNFPPWLLLSSNLHLPQPLVSQIMFSIPTLP